MGLDLVEFVMEIEEAFHIHISDEEAQQINTPRRLINYVYGRLPHSSDGFCVSQRAFYQLRRVLLAKTNITRSSIEPNTKVLAILPNEGREETWASIRAALGASKRWWPELPRWRWFPTQAWFPRTIRGLVKLLVVHYPLTLPEPQSAWTRAQVAKVIYALMLDNLAVDMSQYSDDARFSEDLGIE